MTNWATGWIHLYHEVIIDDKMGLLSDHLWRRAVEFMLAAGAEGREGYLPETRALARKLATTEADLEADLNDLAAPGIKIVEKRPAGWFVVNHAKRNFPKDPTNAKRQAEYRERQKTKYAALHDPLRNALRDPLRDPLITGEEEEEDKKDLTPAFPIPIAGNGSGRTYSEKMKAFNNKLGPELRRTLADALLKITGQLDLANTETDAGTAALYAAHEAAVAVYQMGYKSAEDLLASEDAWYAEDFRGKKGDRPSLKWFVEQCAKTNAGKRDMSPKPVEEYR